MGIHPDLMYEIARSRDLERRLRARDAMHASARDPVDAPVAPRSSRAQRLLRRLALDRAPAGSGAA